MQDRYNQLISSKRSRTSSRPDRELADEMLSDKARILTSSCFRRLQTKAQVFSLEENAAVRTRLTHTLEVSIYGELIASKVAEKLITNGSLSDDLRLPFVTTVESACLLHDVGNPPFGHLGEFAIRAWFGDNADKLKKAWAANDAVNDEVLVQLEVFKHFDGNPQSLRIVAHLQWLRDEYGLNLTYSLLASMIKYLVPMPDEGIKDFGKKVGYFRTEGALITEIWDGLGLKMDGDRPAQRHPLAFIMEAADDIAYSVSDIEDAIEKKIVSEAEFFYAIKKSKSGIEQFIPEDQLPPVRLAQNGAFLIFKINVAAYLVDRAVDAFIAEEKGIIEGSFNRHLLDVDTLAKSARSTLQDFAEQNIYNSHEAIDIELSGYRIIQDILSGFLPILRLKREDFLRLRKDAKEPPKRDQLSLEKRLFTLLPNKHLLAYEFFSEQNVIMEPIFRTHLVVDYLAGMTDSHAVKVFNMINGITS